MWALFQMTFLIGSLPVDYISSVFDLLGEEVSKYLPDSFVKNALVEGVIPAVGTVIAFYQIF